MKKNIAIFAIALLLAAAACTKTEMEFTGGNGTGSVNFFMASPTFGGSVYKDTLPFVVDTRDRPLPQGYMPLAGEYPNAGQVKPVNGSVVYMSARAGTHKYTLGQSYSTQDNLYILHPLVTQLEYTADIQPDIRTCIYFYEKESVNGAKPVFAGITVADKHVELPREGKIGVRLIHLLPGAGTLKTAFTDGDKDIASDLPASIAFEQVTDYVYTDVAQAIDGKLTIRINDADGNTLAFAGLSALSGAVYTVVIYGSAEDKVLKKPAADANGKLIYTDVKVSKNVIAQVRRVY